MDEDCWKIKYSNKYNKKLYFVNKESGYSQWGIPLNKFDKPLPIGWERHISTTTGHMYYENLETKITQWEFPLGTDLDIPVPDGWERKVSQLCKQVYYINKDTKKSQWEYPTKELKPLETVCVELVGDSILDNSYWNDVGTDNTAEILRKININVVDRSTEEVYTKPMIFALKNDTGIKVASRYIQSRDYKKIPYDMTNSLVNPNPSDSYIWNITSNKNKFIVLSLGGNDVALASNLSINDIVNNIRKVIKLLLEKTKISSRHFAYLIPYTPGDNLEKQITAGLKASGQILNGKQFYKNMVIEANKMCKDLDIHCISLSHFTDKEKAGFNIPEPTKKGAKDIADLIVKWIEEEKEAKYW